MKSRAAEALSYRLRHRPHDFAEAQDMSRAILSGKEMSNLERGPYGGVSIYCGR